MYKVFFFSAALACANAGLAPVSYTAAPAYAASAYVAPAYAAYGHAALAPAAITSQSQNILRSYGNLGQVSTYSKTIDTPYSSVTKSDVRVSNPGLASVSYAAPAYAYAAHGAALAAPVARVAKVFSQARAPVAHDKSDDVEVISTGTLTVPSRTPKNQLLGVVYSAAPLVSRVSFVNSRGVKYSW